ncbi:AzlD domain-containing protein [Halarchaeum salinum]|uniref:AzlD domain-containing protein n=1 Tax=Halarchaeum salinum TaxID=489912 RepID=A0AAV3S6B6_9EURY
MTTYDALTTWALIVAIAVPTYLLRFSFIGLLGRLGEVPDWAERALAFVPAAVLAALVVPDVVTVHSTVVATLAQEKVVAGAAAAAVAYYTEDVLATIAVGMGVFWAIRFGLPLVA